MKKWKSMEENDMNAKRVDQLLNTFYRISGLKIILFNSRFQTLASGGEESSAYCKALHRSRKCLDMCMQSDLEGFRRVVQTGDTYIYRCPFGLTEVIAPIKNGENVIGYLIVGPSLLKGKEWDEILLARAQEYAPELPREELQMQVATIKRYSQEDFDAFCETLAVFAAYLEGTGQLSDSEKTIGQLIKSYVKKNLSKKITLAELSLHIHCSTVTLTEHFRREYGMTIMQYVMKKRMDLAEQLLVETALPVTDIAGRCGFSDVEYFSRCFKAAHGLPPTEWRTNKTK